MTDLRQAAQQALEALVTCCAEEWRTLNNFGMKQVYDEKKVNAAIAALRAALAEPQCMCREPWVLERVHREKTPCFDYVERRPLTDEELRECFTRTNTAEPLAEGWPGLERFARAIERAHGIIGEGA